MLTDVSTPFLPPEATLCIREELTSLLITMRVLMCRISSPFDIYLLQTKYAANLGKYSKSKSDELALSRCCRFCPGWVNTHLLSV